MGQSPIGRLTYDDKGNMSVIIARSERSFMSTDDKARASLEEKSEAFDGFEAYLGTYTVDRSEKSVTHHVKSALFPNWAGTLQKRFYWFTGNLLELGTSPMEYAGERGIAVLSWERL